MTVQEYVMQLYPGTNPTQKAMQALLIEAIEGWEVRQADEIKRLNSVIHELNRDLAGTVAQLKAHQS